VVKTVVFTATTLCLFGILAVAVGNLSLAPSHTYAALFTDATGIQTGSPVRVAGVDVGRITSIRLQPNGETRLARVSFTVDRNVPVYKAAEIDLRYENLLGGRYLAIVERPGDSTADSGNTFPVTQTRPALNLTALFNGFQPLFAALNPTQINALSLEIVRTLQGEGGTIADLLANTASLTKNLADRDAVIGRVVTNLTDVLTSLDTRDKSITDLIEGFRTLMTGLATNSDTISQSLPELAKLLDSTSGFLGNVRSPLHDDLVAVGDLASKVASAKDGLDKVLQEMPDHVNATTRVGTYGSWFNYLLCGAQAHVTLGGQAVDLSTPALQANSTVPSCGGGTR
jgi:phospholipid/cholesterol/gamma-HCH transport system substrate-binding protein